MISVKSRIEEEKAMVCIEDIIEKENETDYEDYVSDMQIGKSKVSRRRKSSRHAKKRKVTKSALKDERSNRINSHLAKEKAKPSKKKDINNRMMDLNSFDEDVQS